MALFQASVIKDSLSPAKMNPIQFEKDKFRYYNGTVEAYNMTFSNYLIEMNK